MSVTITGRERISVAVSDASKVAPLRSGRICIVTGELAGPDYNGGIGTANRGLAIALRSEGYHVDVLYTRVERRRPYSYRGTFADQVAAFRKLQINLMCISHDGEWDAWLAKSFRAMEHLIAGQYDIAFFDDTHGTAYYSALAKQTGCSALKKTKLVVVTHSATQWIYELNQTPLYGLEEVRLLEIERRSIELADYVVSPSAYLVGKYRSYGWKMPANTVVRPNVLPLGDHSISPSRRHVAIDEIVFFGRLERRKGLWLFCEALDRLKYDLKCIAVTFLGKFTMENGESTGFTLLRRSAFWPFAPTLLHNYDSEQALDYLKGGNRLAVMPSKEDNSPCAILECLTDGIPLIASAGSGGQELISEEDRANCLFEPTVSGIINKLQVVIRDGISTALPSFDPQENQRRTMSWVSGLLGKDAKRSEDAGKLLPSEDKPASVRLKTTLLLLAPNEADIHLITSAVAEVAAVHPNTSIFVFVSDLSALKDSLAATSTPTRVRYTEIADFGSTVSALAHKKGMVAVCHLRQPVDREWMERAESCFSNGEIDAVTGMVGQARESHRQNDAAYVSEPDSGWDVAELKVGNSPALMALTQDTNAGFIVVRSELLPLVGLVSPVDPHYGRLRVSEFFIQDVVAALMAADKRFELLPDWYVSAAMAGSAFETFDLPRQGRQFVECRFCFAAGSENALLSRLSIEILMGEPKRLNSLRRLNRLVNRVGPSIGDPESYWPPQKSYTTHSRVAQAIGRPELALMFLAHAMKETGQPLPSLFALPSALVYRRAGAVDLFERIEKGTYRGLNLDHEWSVRTHLDRRAFEIHPNASNEGGAGLVLSDLDLSPCTSFNADIELAPTANGAVRFKLELGTTGGHDVLTYEWVLQSGERKSIEVELPPELRSHCEVVLSTEMARRLDSTTGAHAIWQGAAFRP